MFAKIRKFLKNYQNLIIAISVIVICILSIIFGVIPGARKLLEMQKSISELETYTQALRIKVSVLDSLDEAVLRQTLNGLIAAIPADKSLPTVFSTIDGISVNSGAAVLDFTLANPGTLATASSKRLSQEEKALGSNLLPFTLSIGGSYEQIQAFLERAIAVRRFFRIRQFDLAFTQTGNLSAYIGMDAFYAAFPSTLGKIDQKLEVFSENEEQIVSRVSQLPQLTSEDVTSTVPQASVPVGKLNPFAP